MAQMREQTDGQVEFPQENSVTLFDFYCQLTKTQPEMSFIGDRNFQQMYLACSTICDETLERMKTIFSTSEHKAFNMKQFVALHAFDGKKYGGTSTMKESFEFQVQMGLKIYISLHIYIQKSPSTLLFVCLKHICFLLLNCHRIICWRMCDCIAKIL
jgi:hypothetical protein